MDEDVEKTGKKEVWKYPVVGMIVTKVPYADGKGHFLSNAPISLCIDGSMRDVEVDADEEIISILPAPPHTYLVQINGEDMGYEFEGASNPNWIAEYESSHVQRKKHPCK